MDKNVTVVDFETTGLYPDSGDRITEIGAIKMSGNKVRGVFTSLIFPERAIPESATFITGITNEMVKNAPTIGQALPLFTDFVQDDILVMHNAKFDGSFLRYEMKHLSIERNSSISVLIAARKDVNLQISNCRHLGCAGA